MVLQIEKILTELSRSGPFERFREQGIRYARERLSWDGKAKIVTQILCWAAERGPKPDLHPQQNLAASKIGRLLVFEVSY